MAGSRRTSKSLGGAYFYDLGLLGLAGFIATIYVACRAHTRALLMFSTVNIAFFNVYAFSWPLFWIMTACCCLPGIVARPARVLPKLVRARVRNAA
ncbi:MAG: hypothetical protein JWL62_1318 [Hyphomicrobiales bacterium]|nr:hypothetical protein [Hyphomicrobiales bacterium]